MKNNEITPADAKKTPSTTDSKNQASNQPKAGSANEKVYSSENSKATHSGSTVLNPGQKQGSDEDRKQNKETSNQGKPLAGNVKEPILDHTTEKARKDQMDKDNDEVNRERDNAKVDAKKNDSSKVKGAL